MLLVFVSIGVWFHTSALPDAARPCSLARVAR
jgi:hypothetical protein